MSKLHDSLMAYRNHCEDTGQKPKKTYGIYDEKHVLQGWSTCMEDLFRLRSGRGERFKWTVELIK